ncbi:FAD-binding oxidoreductase [Rhodohalobacter sp. SW132]|uniref:FAD-binding and (Fe-S)-binding domain-containing protein n=1 Tax=Rhodohalobacter sp. SW132 TaxID=2293433 RepID=UPI000E221C51|nr:FAD-binding and (Fe-S)-binding domain-containing protein [Rhodohalobacter sp. SW132]REL24805.1 FAD-binding oxidoreductase [Rhodohalobacter sp. SW132]
MIKTDSLTRRLYATDASIYEELPSGVAFPSSVDEIRQLVKEAAKRNFSITARSAGTSLAGQTTGEGIIMDSSRHMTGILEIDPKRQVAHVQPGVIRDTLNREAAKYKLQFGPDTATTNRCMIGGMIGNNSCGSFSIKHRSTREHILEIEAVLSDGSTALFKQLSDQELEEKLNLQTFEGSIYRQILQLLKKHKDEILDHYPHPEIIRRNTGYALDRMCEMSPLTPGGRPFNMAELLCGSEGTLAMTASAKLNLVDLPACRSLVIPQFSSLREAMKAAVEIVKWQPAAVELVDDIILDATKGNIEQNKNRFFLKGDPKCILIVQFEGENQDELEAHSAKLAERLRELNFGYAHPYLSDEDEIRRVWDLRKAGLGLIMGLGNENPSPSFVEDTAVRVEDLPDYVDDFQAMLDRHNSSCVFYAHASVGELHLRPVVNTKTPEGLETMKQMAAEVADIVKKYRGSLSGEHGDGRARAPYIETVLGSEMMPLLRRVKEIWDPNYLFNPGKILDPKPIDTDLRFSPDYNPPAVPTMFKWRKAGGFGNAIELCNGAGVCRKLAQSGGTMCPSYHATREEKDNTRGRANLFRQLFSGKQMDAFESEELKDALSLCLSCKACKSECPANVDMAKMKAEFTHGWHKKNGISSAERFFGQPEKLYPLASFTASVTNFINKQKPTKWLFEKLFNIHPSRNVPEFASQTFQSWYRKNRSDFSHPGAKQVLLQVDIFTNYHEPEIAIAALKVLHSLGYDVLVPFIRPSGRPQISKGLLDEASKICHENINHYYPFAERDIPIVGLEPSEILTLRDEYTDLCREEDLDKAKKIADHTFLWEEFLATELATSDALDVGKGRKVYIHGHCHTKALVGNHPLIQSFRQLGFDPIELKTGCCGMAGSFGYEKDKYEVSMQVGEQVLFPALRELNSEANICAPGFSCRHQISDGVGKKAAHPAVVVAKAMGLA